MINTENPQQVPIEPYEGCEDEKLLVTTTVEQLRVY